MSDERALARLEGALADAGADHAPPAGWEARVLAATAVRRVRWWWLAAPALAAAAAIAVWVAWPRGGAPAPAPLQLALSIERGGPLVRGATAHVGDTLTATSTGGAGARATWIYRADHALITACIGDAPCRVTLAARGDYAVVALLADHPLAAPTGDLDADVAAAARAGARYTIETVTVR